MNLALGTLAATLVLLPPASTGEPASRLPDYPIPAPRLSCVGAPCAGALLTDLALGLGEPGGPTTGEARVLLANRLYLGLRADDESRSVVASTSRWDLAAEHEDDRTTLGGEVRGRRLRLRTRAVDHRAEAGDGWLFDLETALRLSPDFEILAFALEDRRDGPGAATTPRPVSSFGVGARWQKGARLELGARLTSATVETPGGLELDRRALEFDGIYQAERWRLDADLEVDELDGRIDRREAAGGLRLDYRATPHLVVSGAMRERYDLDLGSVGSGTDLEVVYYARRFRFARAGAAGRATVDLARRAWRLGFNERRAHDLTGRRLLRERLQTSTAGDELAALADELYRAQVAERNVAIGGLAVRRSRDDVEGSKLRQVEAFIAIPWPQRRAVPLPRHDETATDFLRLTYGRSERDISRGFTTEGSLLAIDVSLRRDLALRFSWEEPPATGLEFALQTQRPRLFLARLVYRLGI